MRKIITSLFRSGKRVVPGSKAPSSDPEAPSADSPAAPAARRQQRTERGALDGAEGLTPAPDAPQQQQPLEAQGGDAMWKRRGEAWRCALDGILYLTVLGLVAAVELGYLPTPQSGFYCNDPKLNFKFNGDTVPFHILIISTFVIPLVTLWLVETCLARARQGGGVWRCVRAATRPAAGWYREFLLGLGVVLFVTDALKLMVSEPRPHFLDTCRPDAASTCTSPSQWVHEFTCTNQVESSYNVRDSIRSFPSGHTSISVYTALFSMFYLRRALRHVTLLLVPWLQGLFLMYTLFCSLTRITDHRHHWWDVVAGFFVGVGSALYTVRVFCEDFCPRHEDDGDDSLSSSPDGLSRGDVKGMPGRPLLNGHMAGLRHGLKECADLDRDAVPARRLLSSSSSCASSMTAEERELREVSTTS